MGRVGGAELMILVVIALLLFGSARLPQLARSLGQAKNEFKRGEREDLDTKETV